MQALFTVGLKDLLSGPAKQMRNTWRGVQGVFKQTNPTLKSTGQTMRGLTQKTKPATAAAKAQTSALRGLGRQAKQTTGALQGLGKAQNHNAKGQFVGGAGRGMGGAGKGMGAAVGAGLLGAGMMSAMTSGVSVAANFEASMAKVAAVANLDTGSSAFVQLNEQAKKLGATTSFSASEAASGMQFLSMAGFDANQTLAAMPGMLSLAKAGGTDLAATADIASNILSGMGLQANEMGRVGDVMAAAFTSTNVDLTQLGDTMKYVAPNAAKAGASIETVAAMAGLLGNIGIQGSMAGTGLRAIFNRLAGPPVKAKKALKSLGIQTKDAVGNLRSMPDILTDVYNKTKDLGSADQISIFKQIAGAEAGTAFAELVKQAGEGGLQEMIAMLENAEGRAGQVATKMGDNLGGSLKSLGSAWEGLQIEVFTLLIPVIRGLADGITTITRGLSAWAKANPKMAKFAAIFVGIMAAVVAATAAIVIIGPAIAALFGPIGLVIAALALGAAYVIANWDTIGPYFTDTWNWISGVFKAGVNLIKAIFTGDWTGIKSAWGNLQGFFTWDGIMQTLVWGTYLTPLAWLNFIPGFSWVKFLSPIKWVKLATKLLWSALISPFKWLGMVPKIGWKKLAGKLSWRVLLTALKWGTRLIPVIGWAVLAGELLWSLLIKPMGWGKYINPINWLKWLSEVEWKSYILDFSWDSVFTICDWLSWLSPIRWLDFFPNFEWSDTISNFSWDSVFTICDWLSWLSPIRWLDFLPNFEWSDTISNFSWDSVFTICDWLTWLSPIKWLDFFPGFEWSDMIADFSWDSVFTICDWLTWLSPIKWLDFLPGFEWSDMLPDLDWGADNLIPKITNWGDFLNIGALTTLWDGAWSGAKTVAQGVFDTVKGWWDGLWGSSDKETTEISIKIDGASGTTEASNIAEQIAQPLKDMDLAAIVSSRLTDIKTVLVNFNLGVQGTRIVNTLRDSFRNANLWTGLKVPLNAAQNNAMNFSLHKAGQNIVNTLIKGIKSRKRAAAAAMGEVTTGIRAYLPFSPAKEGALRDLHRIKLVETLAGAITPRPAVAAMARVTAGMMAALPGTLPLPALQTTAAHPLIPQVQAAQTQHQAGQQAAILAQMQASQGPRGGDTIHLTINVDGGDPQAVADAVRDYLEERDRARLFDGGEA